MTLAVLALIFRFVNLREVNSEHYELYNTAKKHYLDTICHFDNVYYIYDMFSAKMCGVCDFSIFDTYKSQSTVTVLNHMTLFL